MNKTPNLMNDEQAYTQMNDENDFNNINQVASKNCKQNNSAFQSVNSC